MYRSSSSTRVSDEYFASTSPPPSPADQLLPTYNSPQQPSKKEKPRIRSAENVIHFIPLLLILCSIILWSFSTPVNLVTKGEHSLVAKETTSITRGGGVDKGANSGKVVSQNKLMQFDEDDQSEDKDTAN